MLVSLTDIARPTAWTYQLINKATFHEPLISKTLQKLLIQERADDTLDSEEETPTCTVFLQYRGKITEDYVHALPRLKAPILTFRKLKNVLPHMKETIEIALKSRLVYKLVCSRCGACYVGQTDRHLLTRLLDHLKPSQPVGKHTRLCEVSMYISDKDNVSVLQSTNRCLVYLMTL